MKSDILFFRFIFIFLAGFGVVDDGLAGAATRELFNLDLFACT